MGGLLGSKLADWLKKNKKPGKCECQCCCEEKCDDHDKAKEKAKNFFKNARRQTNSLNNEQWEQLIDSLTNAAETIRQYVPDVRITPENTILTSFFYNEYRSLLYTDYLPGWLPFSYHAPTVSALSTLNITFPSLAQENVPDISQYRIRFLPENLEFSGLPNDFDATRLQQGSQTMQQIPDGNVTRLMRENAGIELPPLVDTAAYSNLLESAFNVPPSPQNSVSLYVNQAEWETTWARYHDNNLNDFDAFAREDLRAIAPINYQMSSRLLFRIFIQMHMLGQIYQESIQRMCHRAIYLLCKMKILPQELQE